MNRHDRIRWVVSCAAVFVSTIGILGGVGSELGPANATIRPHDLTLYSLATESQFVNNADDRARGKGNNPFGNFQDAKATVTQPGGSPFPGDEAIYKFSLYTTMNLKKKSAGSAILTCQYNFDHNAYCDAEYTLHGGTLFGAGAFNFNTDSFVISVTGGTGTYLAMSGDIKATPGPQHSQRLAITLD
jgi:hypothetical protein